jgi:thiol:disulfide interchange protein DsbD
MPMRPTSALPTCLPSPGAARAPIGGLGGWRLAAAAWFAAGTMALLGLATPVQAQPVKTDHVTAELVTERGGVAPGGTLAIGLRLQHIPQWHTYWRNPGDSGLPTRLSWTLPAGVTVGEIDWPAPQRLPIGPLVNYGYEGDLLLPMSLAVPADARPGDTLRLQAQANWLVCHDVCIPEEATLNLAVPIVEGMTPAPTEHAARFERTRIDQPRPIAGWQTRVEQAGRELQLTLTREGAAAETPGLATVEFFPFAEQVVQPAAHQVWRTPQGFVVRMALADNVPAPGAVEGIVVARPAAGPAAPAAAPTPWGHDRTAAVLAAPVQAVATLALPEGAQPLAAWAAPGSSKAGGVAGGAASVASPAATPQTLGGAGSVGLWGAIALAFLGGMLLNLMPCVFPVLSIKLLSLTQHKPGSLHVHALAYTVGVVGSFLALAAVLLALRAAGSGIGWGFQLQQPGVVFVLALLFFAIGLNLMGAFELRQVVPQALAGWRAERPSVDAFASGVLAVVAASPCTAPFMGAALGYAVTQSAWTALAVFGALGLGMALPYALLVWVPGWRDRLPRPGPWMVTFKQALAFPMFATVVWLLWVLGQQAGIDGAAKAMLGLLVLGVVVWWSSLPSKRPALARGAALIALGAGVAWSWPQPAPVAAASGPVPASPVAGRAATWQAYDEAAIDRHTAEGRAVFVDFTAAWCVSCQVNKRLVLDTVDTQAAFAEAGVVLMRADWTNRDERITRALERLGRNGVPVYLLVRPGQDPLLLPEILTAGLVREALATLSTPSKPRS